MNDLMDDLYYEAEGLYAMYKAEVEKNRRGWRKLVPIEFPREKQLRKLHGDAEIRWQEEHGVRELFRD